MKLQSEEDRTQGTPEDAAARLQSLCSQAAVLQERRDLDGALKLFKEATEICRQSGDTRTLPGLLSDQANILRRTGDFEGATALHKEEERICREAGFAEGLASSLGNQAVIAASRHQNREAQELIDEAVSVAAGAGLDELRVKLTAVQTRIRKRQPMELSEEEAREARADARARGHDRADPNEAMRRNIEYQQAIAAWEALPWLKKLRTKKPEPPGGI
jgi:tetratricopeptide (TPR) repeat protein